jgi:hypothetical protein
MEPDPLTLKDLESIRAKLVQQIEEAEQLFSAESNATELLTSKSALKYVEELIRSAQEPEVA